MYRQIDIDIGTDIDVDVGTDIDTDLPCLVKNPSNRAPVETMEPLQKAYKNLKPETLKPKVPNLSPKTQILNPKS